MGPADREKVRPECNQFFPERCINMMAQWQGEGEGHAACPQPSELSAEGQDEMMRTEGARGLPGGGVAAAGVGKRSHHRRGNCGSKVWRSDMSLYAASCPT